MADQDKPAAPALAIPQAMGVAQPVPTQNAGHLVIAGGISEMSVMFGQTRLAPSQQGGQQSAVAFVEWFATITMSPPVAQQLRDGLNDMLANYTEVFGPIPKSTPDQMAKMAEAAAKHAAQKK